MKKLIRSLLCCAIIWLLSVTASAEKDGYYTYEISNGEAIITGVDASISGYIVVPSELGGYPVVRIDECAFFECNGLTDVVIPDSVVTIGKGAFFECCNLVNIVIGDGVQLIDEDAFGCCYSLENLELENSVNIIGNDSFFGCDNLKKITVAENNAYYCSQDGVLYNKQKNVLIRYPSGKGGSSYIVPDNVSIIADEAFGWCNNLEEIVIGENVTEIGRGAFKFCEKLVNIKNLDNVNTIGEEAFLSTEWYNNQPYGSVYAGNVLYGYKGEMKETTKIVVKRGTKSISPFAFAGCSNLTAIELPKGLKEIGQVAFAGCKGLTKIEIPGSVTTINPFAYYDCDNINEVCYSGNMSMWGKIEINEQGNEDLLSAKLVFATKPLEVEFKNDENREISALFITYDEKFKILDVIRKDSANTKKEIIEVSDKTKKYKILYWESLANLKPVYEPITKEL